MKKALSVFLTMILILALVPTSALAIEPVAEIILTPSITDMTVSDADTAITYVVSLKILDPTAKIGSIEFNLAPPASVTLASTSLDWTYSGTTGIFYTEDYVNGTKKYTGVVSSYLTGKTTTTLLTINGTIAANTSGSIAMGVTNVIVGDDLGENELVATTTVNPTVITKEISSIEINTAPTKTDYVVGQSFDPAGTVLKVNYSDSTNETIAAADFHTKGVTYIPAGALATSNTAVTFSYGGKSVDQTISVDAKAISSIAVTTPSSKLSFKQDEDFSYPSLAVTATYNDESTAVLAADAYTVTGSTATVGNGQTATIKLNANNSITTTYTFDVTAKALTSIDITTEPTKTIYTVGETFSTTGMVVKAYYDNGKDKTLTSSDYSISGNDISTFSTGRTVTVSYTDGVEKTDTFTITVSAAKLTATAPTLTQGDTDGLMVTWGTVANADGYTVKIYQGNTLKKTIPCATGASPLAVNIDGTDIVRGTSYTATLTANIASNNLNYLDSDESAKSSAVAAKGKTLNFFAFSVTNNSQNYTGSPQAPTVAYTDSTYTTANAGAITVGLGSDKTADATNAATYDVFVKAAGGTVYDPLTVWTDTERDFIIAKTAYPDSVTKTVELIKNLETAQTGTLTANDFFDTAPDGAKIYSIPAAGTLLTGLRIGGGQLHYTSDTNIIATTSATYRITIISTNYSDISATLTFKPVDKANAGVTFTGTVPTTKTYGDSTFQLTASAANLGTGTGVWTWTSSDPTVLSVSGTTGTADVTVLKAGSATISAKYESNTTTDTATTDAITVEPKTLRAADLEYTGSAITKEYDATTDCTLTSVAVKFGVLVGDDALTISGTAVYNSKDVAAATKVTFTPTAITTGNYRLAATETLDITAAITKAPLTIDDITPAAKTYDGTTAVTINSVGFDGLQNSETLAKGTDYTVAGVFNDKNVASATEIAATVTLTNGNYSLATNTFEKAATIGKADYTVTVAATQDITVGSGLSAITVDDNIKGEGVNGEKVAGTLKWYVDVGYTILAEDISLSTLSLEDYRLLRWEFIATDSNYVNTGKRGSTGFTAVAGDPQTLTFSGVSGGTVTETYGDAKFTFVASNDRDDGGTITYTSSATGVATVDFATGEVTIVGAGTATITAKAAAVSGKYAEGIASYTLNVNSKPVTVTGVSAEDKAYDGDTAATITGAASVGTLTNASLVTSGANAAFENKTVGEDKTVTFSGYTLTGTGAGNYSLSQPASVTADITAKALTITGATVTGRDYSGATDVEVTAVTLSGVVGTETVSVKIGTGGVTGTMSSANADSYTSVDLENISLEGADKANYSIEATADDVITTVTIDKATWGDSIPDQNISWKYNVTGGKSADFPTGLPGDRGTSAYAVVTVSNTNDVLTGTPIVNADTGEVTYTLAGKPEYTAGQTATIPVVVTMQNYDSVTVNFVITLADKDVPVLTADNLTITYTGSDIPVSAVTGKTAKFNGAEVAGIWSWKSTAPKNVATATSYTLVFSPTDSENYATAEKTITVIINKKDPSGTPSYTAISTSGKTLADAALAVGSLIPAEGTIKWVDNSNVELPATTVVTANTSYKWLFTPTDSDNYNTLTGSIRLYRISGGGDVSTYGVTVTAATGGTITVSPEDASRGTTVTITVQPDEGYVQDTLTATDGSGKTVELTKESDGTYTFTMPASDVTVTGAFKKAAPPVNPFIDVTEPDWFYDDVMFTFVNGMMQGVRDDLFDVHGSTTRGMIVTVLYRMENDPDAVGNPFDDVANDKYYTSAVAWAAANKIVNGYGPGRFGPEDHVTREQVATILYNYAVYKGYDVSVGENTNILSFKDALDVHDWAMPAMQWACGTGLIRGYDGYLTPQDSAERCQIAAIFHRFCDVVQ